jgi:thiosulfate/3-mercaptopyruvate sulfurtransferase
MRNFMKKTILFKSFLLCCSLFLFQQTHAQNAENWTSKQLMEPAALASLLTAEKNVPLIFSVGPGAVIPHSVSIGMTNDNANLDKLKKELKGVDKKANIVLYCGCCPFEHCPNVRPAIDVLKAMNFTNYKLLNLPHNIKTDWISKGYPTVN